MDERDEFYMLRCLQLAQLGAGKVAPNPMVGSVLVYSDRIIGEGYHQQFGGPHAEPNSISSVSIANEHLISLSTLYVSLEPCAHFGKTPPCANLILQNQIKKVVIGCADPFEAVNGKGIEILQATGVDVKVGVLENECRELNKAFFTYHTKKRPFVVLKWAQSADGFIGSLQTQPASRVQISNDYSNRLVHKWRSQMAAILVGTNTAINDDPLLTNRLWSGNNPVRLVIDLDNRLPQSAKLLNKEAPTMVFNRLRSEQAGNISFYQFKEQGNELQQLLQALYEKGLNSIFVEGGAKLLQSFIDAGLWDEARIITNPDLYLQGGVKAPILHNARLTSKTYATGDSIAFFEKDSKHF